MTDEERAALYREVLAERFGTPRPHRRGVPAPDHQPADREPAPDPESEDR
ncbi:hypothetical protein O7626_39500 [Micromonospora sp. WMMD1102]|nr:hypothetical protein [Micromonospora sp. WMMD1102]MDG4784398.1 hypothetical protein [Micromonospora sp. WMMD1102]MDG4791902.1 hypothetical protein [Micromonospora sp. WMMD1102]